MRVLRSEFLFTSEQLDEFLSAVRHAGILVAHGAERGAQCAGKDSQYILARFQGTHLWLHACLCANRLGVELAQAGIHAFGFRTKIVFSLVDRCEVDVVERAFRSASRTGDPGDIVRAVQNNWHALAVDALERHRFIQASILTHLALSVRHCAGRVATSDSPAREPARSDVDGGAD